jgi:ubiquinone/menaquinone biosynthesis C-methylase UbiE
MDDPAIEVVCPLCRKALVQQLSGSLACANCSATFPLRTNVPILVAAEEYGKVVKKLKATRNVWERYSNARRQSTLTMMYYDWWVSRMFAEIPSNYRGPLLELMAGGGEISRRLPDRFEGAVALDLNVFMTERAAQDLEASGEHRVKFLCGSVSRLPFRSGSVPLAMIQGGLHHVRPILDDALREISRVLAPGGLLIASEPANDHPIIRWIRRWQYAHSTQQGGDEDGFTKTEIASRFSSVGLQLVDYHLFGFIAYPLMGNTDLLPLLAKCSSKWLGRLLLLIDQLIERIPIGRRIAFASIITASKGNS